MVLKTFLGHGDVLLRRKNPYLATHGDYLAQKHLENFWGTQFFFKKNSPGQAEKKT